MILSRPILIAAALIAAGCVERKVEAAVAGETNSAAPAEAIVLAQADPETQAGVTAAAETDTTPAAVSDEERFQAIASLGLEYDADGQVLNDCGEAVTPDVHATDLGGAIGRALLVVMKGGPNTASCYGDTGMQFFLLKAEGSGFKQIASGMGHFAPMATEHNGVKDFAVGGPGMEFPVYEWSGRAYVATRQIPDTEFPQSLN